jgi:transcriptional regulator with XRE-family HTH domain
MWLEVELVSKEKLRGSRYNEPFARRLDDLLSERRISQTMLAKASESIDADIRITRQTISSYINGDTLPDIKRFKFIADYFNVSYDYLLGESEVKQRENVNIAEKTGLNEEAIANLILFKNVAEKDELSSAFFTRLVLTVINFLVGSELIVALASAIRQFHLSMTSVEKKGYDDNDLLHYSINPSSPRCCEWVLSEELKAIGSQLRDKIKDDKILRDMENRIRMEYEERAKKMPGEDLSNGQ